MCYSVDDINSNFLNKNKPIAKGLKRQSSNEDFGEGNNDTRGDQEDDGEGEHEGGPVENLMEPGKKI
jgi:hypothetical protein